MSVLPMERVTICAMRKDRKQILEYLQHESVVEVSNAAFEDDVFSNEDTSAQIATFNKNSDVCAEALMVLDRYAPVKTSLLAGLNGRKHVGIKEYESESSRRDAITKTAYSIITLSKRIAEDEASVPKLEMEYDALEMWMSLDIPLDFTGTKNTFCAIGTVPSSVPDEILREKLFSSVDEDSGIDLEVIGKDDQLSYLYVISSKKDADAVNDVLRTFSFARPPLSSVTPADRRKSLSEEKNRILEDAAKTREEITALSLYREGLKFMADYYKMRADKYSVIAELAQSKNTFILEGYVARQDEGKLLADLNSNFEADVNFEKPSEDEDVPVRLKNNAFAAPLEPIVESYSMPGKDDIDPSFLSAVFYYIFFGMMLSDAAYGAIMVIVTGILLAKYKNMEKGTKQFLSLFFFCGWGTILSGVLFGSYFGDAVPVIAKTFFGKEISIWFWMDPAHDPMGLLRLAFLLGILHLFTGLGIKFYMYVRKGQILDAIYDCVFWYMLVGGLVVVLLASASTCQMIGLEGAVFPAVSSKIAVYVAIIGSAGIVLTGGRESSNWVKRIMKGAYALYGVTGYLGDVLSYSRLLALGLATGMIAQVFNKMGSMMGNGIAGVIVFILVFMVGQTLNFAINAMGAYVHSNRLTFVEFFGKFYNGGGHPFMPFTMNTKYIKVCNDETKAH